MTDATPVEHAATLVERLRLRMPRLVVTPLLIAANVLVFLAMLAFGAGFWHSPNNVQLAWGANFAPATEDGEWWRLGSAMFVHFGLLHLATNMLALADAGHFVERMFGRLRFAAIYAASGITGNLLSLLVHGDQAVSGGASGAVFGIYGALLVYLARHRRQLAAHEFRWLFGGAAAFALATIAFGLLVTGIDNAAHLGGLATGLFGGLALQDDVNGRGKRLAHAAAAAWVAIVVGLAINVPEPRYRWREELQARGKIDEFLVTDRRLSRDWNAILAQGRAGGESLDHLAAQLESDVVGQYASSFDQLAALHLDPAAPSAPALDFVRNYAEIRRNASQALVEGLRADDPEKIRAALALAARGRKP